MVGLVWSYDPKSYADSINTTGKASHARQVKGDDPDKKGLGLGHEANKLSSIKKNLIIEKPNGCQMDNIGHMTEKD